MIHSDRSAYLMLTAMAICFGGTWVPAAIAVDSIPPFTIAVVRFGIAAVLLAAWARLSGGSLSPIRGRDWWLVLGLAVTAVAGYNWLFLTALTMAPATDGAIIVPGMAPVFTAILAGAALGERLGRRGFAGLAVAAVGLYLVVDPTGGTSPERLIGDGLFVAGAALWGVYSVLARIASRRFNAVSTSLYGIAVGTGILVPLALLEGGLGTLAAAPPEALAGIGYLAVFGTVAAFVLLNLGVARIGAARASAFALVVPIVGVVTSVWLLGERIGPLTLLGGAIVLGGLWLIEHRGGDPRPRRAAIGSEAMPAR